MIAWWFVKKLNEQHGVPNHHNAITQRLDIVPVMGCEDDSDAMLFIQATTPTAAVTAPVPLGTVTLPKTTPAPTPLSINTSAANHTLSTVTAELAQQHAADFRAQQINRIVNKFLQLHPPKAGTNLSEYLKVNIP